MHFVQILYSMQHTLIFSLVLVSLHCSSCCCVASCSFTMPYYKIAVLNLFTAPARCFSLCFFAKILAVMLLCYSCKYCWYLQKLFVAPLYCWYLIFFSVRFFSHCVVSKINLCVFAFGFFFFLPSSYFSRTDYYLLSHRLLCRHTGLTILRSNCKRYSSVFHFIFMTIYNKYLLVVVKENEVSGGTLKTLKFSILCDDNWVACLFDGFFECQSAGSNGFSIAVLLLLFHQISITDNFICVYCAL